MANIAGVICNEKNYSYQHIQGVMLLNLNKLACELKLTHSEFRLMATLIGLWNKQKGMAFPTIEYLAHVCCMGKQTVTKNLNKLVELNLLVVIKSSGKRNNYFFSRSILSTGDTASRISCNTAHDNKQIKNKTNNKIIQKTNPDKKISTSCSAKSFENYQPVRGEKPYQPEQLEIKYLSRAERRKILKENAPRLLNFSRLE